jgi:NADPH:quinone reductase
MRAALIAEFGEPLRVGDTNEPHPDSGAVVVDLIYAGVNPLDVRLSAGGAGRVSLPFVPGCDGSGRLDGVPVVVYGDGLGVQRQGTYAERVAVRPEAVVAIPEGLDERQAAAVGLAGVTAWGLVHRSALISAEDVVLVLGASGGVGFLAVQLARRLSAHVWAQTTDPVDEATLRAVSDGVVVAEAPRLRETAALKPTVVIDALGGAYTGAALHLVRPKGRIVVFGTSAGALGQIDLSTLYRKAVTIHGHAALMMPAQDAHSALAACLSLVAQGQLRVHVDSVLPLTQVNEAHKRIAQRQATGKILLSVSE